MSEINNKTISLPSLHRWIWKSYKRTVQDDAIEYPDNKQRNRRIVAPNRRLAKCDFQMGLLKKE